MAGGIQQLTIDKDMFLMAFGRDVDYEAITAYPGNYADFGRQKAATRERQETEQSKAEKAIAESAAESVASRPARCMARR